MSDPKIGTGKKPPNSGRRLYTDENSKNTIPIKFSNVSDVKDTILKLEGLYKKGSRDHARISQVANVMEQRSRFMKNKDKEHALAKRYTEFLKKRTKLKQQDRMKLNFKM
jgi:hypothetical protein